MQTCQALAHNLAIAKHKVIESEKEFPILVQDLAKGPDSNFEINISRDDLDSGQLLHLELTSKNTDLSNNKPYNLQVSFLPDAGTQFSLNELNATENANWKQDPSNLDLFYKPIGLSEFSAKALVRNVFSEFDFSKQLLKGEDFGIAKGNSFNDFLLNSEAIGVVYDLLVDGLIDKTLPGEFLLTHVSPERFEQIDLSYVQFNLHDASVIDAISGQLQDGNYNEFKSIFLFDILISKLLSGPLAKSCTNIGNSFSLSITL